MPWSPTRLRRWTCPCSLKPSKLRCFEDLPPLALQVDIALRPWLSHSACRYLTQQCGSLTRHEARRCRLALKNSNHATIHPGKADRSGFFDLVGFRLHGQVHPPSWVMPNRFHKQTSIFMKFELLSLRESRRGDWRLRGFEGRE